MTRATSIFVVASLLTATLGVAGTAPNWAQKRQPLSAQSDHGSNARDVNPSARDNGKRNVGRNDGDSSRGGRPPHMTESPPRPPVTMGGDRGQGWSRGNGGDRNQGRGDRDGHDNHEGRGAGGRDGSRDHARDDNNGNRNRGGNGNWNRDHSRDNDRNRDWDRNHWNGDRGRDWNRNHWRDDRGRDWHHDRGWYDHYRANHYRYYGGRYYSRTRFSIGIYLSPFAYYRQRFWADDLWLPGAYYESRYYVGDYWSYDLYDPPAGCRWVRVGNDALLVDTWTGQVIDQVYDLFW